MMSDSRLYDELIMDHIKNARNYRALDDANRTAAGSNPLCGDDLTVYVRVERDRLEEVTFLCTCCGVSMASASIMTESMTGKSASDAKALARAFAELLATRADPMSSGGDAAQRAVLTTVRDYPVRMRCAALPWLTLEAALDGRKEAIFVR